MASRCARPGAAGARALSSVFAALMLLGPAHARQTGFTVEKHDDLGITFQVPLTYEPLPVPPDEPSVVLAYAEKLRAKAPKSVRPAMDIVWIDALPDLPPRADESAGASGRPPVNSLERFIGRRYPGWTIGKSVEARPQGAYRAREVMLAPSDRETRPIIGWAYVFENDARAIALVGVCGDYELKEQVALWRTCAERMRLYEPIEGEPSAVDALYAKSTLRDPKFRIDVRKRLVRGWRAEDTENYIVIYGTRDQPLIRKMCLDIEFLRRQYQTYFPPTAPITAVSTVRVCRDRDEYLAYGGDADSLGYWYAAAEELVLYDAAKAKPRAVSDDSDTFEALYHEAFHQFIHYSAGELAPHPWFNEGHGDFFGGATVRGDACTIRPNARRLAVIQSMIAKELALPWSRIVRMEERPFMESAARCYAQSWSMVYFLRTASAVAVRPEWSKILPTYFDVLKSAYAEASAAIPEDKRDDVTARWQARQAARTRAVDAAFEGVDFAEIESSWRAFVVDLPSLKGR